MTVTINGTTGIAGVDGSAATPATQGADTNTGIFYGTDVVGVSTGGSERMRVDASGNVGIGTSSPSFTGVSRRALTLNAPSGQLSILELGVNGTLGGYLYSNASQVTLTSSGATPITLETNGSERMRIDSSGNLLVGTTSSDLGKLLVRRDSSTLPVVQLQNEASSGKMMTFHTNGDSQVGSISYGISTVAYNTSSDYRLKENIQPMQNALDVVAQLNPVTYTWKADGSDGQGFIAHELQAVVPDCVTGEKDAVDAEGNPVYQGIDTSFLVATLTAAIKEQQAIINELTARVSALEGK